MKAYLHLAETGLVKTDLSLRLYDSNGDSVSVSSITLTELETDTDYLLDNIPEEYDGLTLTFESPLGVYHSRRFGVSESQPPNVIIPIREVSTDPIGDLTVIVLQDGVQFEDIIVSQLSNDGEYLISGWPSPSLLGENWSIRWTYNDQVFSVQWTGTFVSGPSYYISILARQSPFEYGKDPLNRVLFSCNYDCRARYPIGSFIHGMAKYISDNGLGTIATNLFIGPQVEVPSGDGPYVTLKQTGGFAPDSSHNTKNLNLGLQVIVTSLDYDEGDLKAKSIHSLLDETYGLTLTV